MRKFLLALIALVCFSVPAVAQSQDCIPVNADLKIFESAGGTNPEYLEGRSKSLALQFFEEELPVPVGQIPPHLISQIIVFMGDFPDGRGVLAAGIEGQICSRKIIPAEHFQRVKTMILGQPTI
jgi:hypothetical protein